MNRWILIGFSHYFYFFVYFTLFYLLSFITLLDPRFEGPFLEIRPTKAGQPTFIDGCIFEIFVDVNSADPPSYEFLWKTQYANGSVTKNTLEEVMKLNETHWKFSPINMNKTYEKSLGSYSCVVRHAQYEMTWESQSVELAFSGE